MRKWICALAFVGLTAGVITVSVAAREKKDDKKDEKKEKPDPKKVKELMRKKLEFSQKVLEGLAVNNLEMASKNAEELLKVRKEAAWMVHQTTEYTIWSDEFTRNAEGIVKAAKDKNLEAAKLNYLGMTLACFHCHTYVRDLGRVNLEVEPRP
jgi:hypothetical protein